MKTNRIVSASLALMLGWSGTAFAQNEIDALRYSRLGVSGSARIQGIGGAQTALGADISTIGANPAGLGMFRRSEVSFTPSFGVHKANATMDGIRTNDERNSIGIPHMGVVVSNRKGDSDDSDWRGASFGVSLTRLNNFNSRITYNGIRDSTDFTIVEYFGELARNNGRTRGSLDAEFNNGYTSMEGLAFGTYLINVDDNGNPPVTVLDRVGLIGQQEEIIRKGSQSQIDIGVGTSYKDRIYLGASLGVVTSDFSQERYFTETESSNQTEFTNLVLRDEFRTRGAGVNLKLGVIFRPIDALRLGATVQTPTAYTLNDTYQRSLSVGFDDGTTETATELPGEYSYSLTTPFRATGGAAFFLSKYGFISADVEYVNYGNARFSEANDGGSGSGNFFSGVNSTISNAYGSALNYRVGAEGRYEVFRIRAGYALSSNPYNNSAYGDGKANTFTFGGGVRLLNYYADVAYVTTSVDTRYSPYVFESGAGPVADITEKRNGLVFTVGYNF